MAVNTSGGFWSSLWTQFSGLGVHPLTAALISAIVSGAIIVGGPILQEQFNRSILFDLQDTVADSCFASEVLHVTISDSGQQVYSNWLVVDLTARPTDEVTAKLQHPGLYRVSVSGYGQIVGSVTTSRASGDFPFTFNGVTGQRYLLNSHVDASQCASPPRSYQVSLAG